MTRYLFVATAVGSLGSGAGGGVELNLLNLGRHLQATGDQVQVLAASGSQTPGLDCTPVEGFPPPYAQHQARTAPTEIRLPSLLANLWQRAHQRQTEFDIIVNWGYDWLPFYLTSFFNTPVVHIVSMGSLSDGVDSILNETLSRFPRRIALHSRAQAATFGWSYSGTDRDPFVVLPCGLDLSQYQFNPTQAGPLCWIGRIAPEKGLEDCAAVAQATGLPVWVLGHMQDPAYWQQIQSRYPAAPLHYQGFLPTAQMQTLLGQSRALLMTPKWIEAFGMVVVEALACGVPVVTYGRGGPAEIVEPGKTGWIVEPDNWQEMVRALSDIPKIDRRVCRQHAEQFYSIEVMAEQFRLWIREVLQSGTDDT
ncbi:MAG: glycosyltransferase family 4 protein [Cyanobacteriota bacterium]|nr:glycosyltransferase family 4 protein [Cyanobacteriota bacterium]